MRVVFERPVIRRKPMSGKEQRREEVRRQVAVAQYLRQASGAITVWEAEQMYEEFGPYAPNRKYRR